MNTHAPAHSAMTVLKSSLVTGLLPAAGPRTGADSGDPQLGVQAIAPNAAGNTGVWECTPGGWPVVDRKDTEVAFILSGRAVITDETTGLKHDISVGDLIVLPVGWSGRWDVLETVRKIYTIQ